MNYTAQVPWRKEGRRQYFRMLRFETLDKPFTVNVGDDCEVFSGVEIYWIARVLAIFTDGPGGVRVSLRIYHRCREDGAGVLGILPSVSDKSWCLMDPVNSTVNAADVIISPAVVYGFAAAEIACVIPPGLLHAGRRTFEYYVVVGEIESSDARDGSLKFVPFGGGSILPTSRSFRVAPLIDDGSLGANAAATLSRASTAAPARGSLDLNQFVDSSAARTSAHLPIAAGSSPVHTALGSAVFAANTIRVPALVGERAMATNHSSLGSRSFLERISDGASHPLSRVRQEELHTTETLISDDEESSDSQDELISAAAAGSRGHLSKITGASAASAATQEQPLPSSHTATMNTHAASTTSRSTAGKSHSPQGGLPNYVHVASAHGRRSTGNFSPTLSVHNDTAFGRLEVLGINPFLLSSLLQGVLHSSEPSSSSSHLSRFRGVVRAGGGWRACVFSNGRPFFSPVFDKEIAAALAHDREIILLHLLKRPFMAEELNFLYRWPPTITEFESGQRSTASVKRVSSGVEAQGKIADVAIEASPLFDCMPAASATEPHLPSAALSECSGSSRQGQRQDRATVNRANMVHCAPPFPKFVLMMQMRSMIPSSQLPFAMPPPFANAAAPNQLGGEISRTAFAESRAAWPLASGFVSAVAATASSSQRQEKSSIRPSHGPPNEDAAICAGVRVGDAAGYQRIQTCSAISAAKQRVQTLTLANRLTTNVWSASDDDALIFVVRAGDAAGNSRLVTFSLAAAALPGRTLTSVQQRVWFLSLAGRLPIAPSGVTLITTMRAGDTVGTSPSAIATQIRSIANALQPFTQYGTVANAAAPNQLQLGANAANFVSSASSGDALSCASMLAGGIASATSADFSKRQEAPTAKSCAELTGKATCERVFQTCDVGGAASYMCASSGSGAGGSAPSEEEEEECEDEGLCAAPAERSAAAAPVYTTAVASAGIPSVCAPAPASAGTASAAAVHDDRRGDCEELCLPGDVAARSRGGDSGASVAAAAKRMRSVADIAQLLNEEECEGGGIESDGSSESDAAGSGVGRKRPRPS